MQHIVAIDCYTSWQTWHVKIIRPGAKPWPTHVYKPSVGRMLHLRNLCQTRAAEGKGSYRENANGWWWYHA